ncbi:molybdopterin molybdenumtransferase MoeA [Sulfitobacter albidus]|uniref:Molybdopterin molybdenumtransferase n=1 Tax=Sulfitobacter albidus TaxID=2829501 RepID=A0A975PLV5_9RHOB|nr:gephyrin-like molybdotransferase Glp [Sulfitobacter albidus]QUJ75575.1 molybdopterin molybdenumtransferase MoeA [Sulfitobacter albidus]
MSGFDTVLVVDWSAGKRAPKRPSKDAIWLGLTRQGVSNDPVYCRTRAEAEAWIADLIATEGRAGRRLLATFDFPFGTPAGFARAVTGSDDPFALWAWFADAITDAPDGSNNRYDVAERLNALFDGPGPFWGKSHRDRWPGVPYRKEGIRFDTFAEKRACDAVAKAASSCFQMAFPPTVGGQMMMGLPMLHRLRALGGVAVWPFEDTTDAPVVLAEIWPGLIEEAVKSAPEDEIRDRAQVRLLADALARLPTEELAAEMGNLPDAARVEAWILGARIRTRLTALASTTAPPLRNDCFALPPGVHWTPVEEALAHLRAALTPVTGTETVPLAEALGRITAADITARRANPPLPNTAVDGYGFAGGRDAGLHRLPLTQARAAAGDAPATVPEGHAIRILTGAALPQGVDTVVLQEDTVIDGDHVSFHGPIKPGANTRRAGEDFAQGDTVLPAARRITPADLALLSAAGHAGVPVRARLRVGVLSTGDELVEPGADVAPGQIHDANRPMLRALITAFGHSPVDLGRAPDDRAALRRTLDAAAPQVDAILTSGGASAGDEDHVSALLQETGTLNLWRIAVKPGRPLALGLWDGVPVFGLPGNPVAAMVCTLIFARPALGVLAGAAWEDPQGFDVPAAFTKAKKEGRTEYLRARIRDGRAEVFASEGSGRISGLSWAEGLVALGSEARQITPGDPVRFLPFASFGL